MKILVLSAYLPVSPLDAGSPRLFCLCNEFSKNAKLKLVTTRSRDEIKAGCRNFLDFEKIFEEIISVKIAESSSWIGRNLHRAFFCPSYYTWYRYKQTSISLRNEIQKQIDIWSPDLIYIHGIEMLQYLPTKCEVDVCFDLVDSISLFHYRIARSATSMLSKLLAWIEYRNALSYEKKAIRISKIVSVVSEVDAKWIKEKFLGVEIIVSPNGLSEEFLIEHRILGKNKRILFVGSMSYEPNIDAVMSFADYCFPQIVENIPEAEFWIVGASPTREVKELANRKGIIVTGTVDSVVPFYQDSALLVCPMRIGTGIKNKILQGMGMRLPVVGTPLAFDGINVKHREHCLISNKLSELADLCCSVLESPDEYAPMTERAFEVIRTDYCWDHAASLLIGE